MNRTLAAEFAEFASDTLPITPAPDEATYKRLWLDLRSREPLDVAFAGGAIADRLAWVFAAAYQAAMRACFDGARDDAWIALCASEDRTGEFPGVQLKGGTLSGSKSWVAGSATLDQMIVTIGRSPRNGSWLLDCDAPGVEVVQLPRKKFLGDLSQGAVNLTRVAADHQVNVSRADHFGIAEPFFVGGAALPYLLREARRLNQSMEADLQAIADDIDPIYQAGFHTDIAAVLAVQQRCAAAGKALAALAGEPDAGPGFDWAADGRLLGMYGRGLRARLDQAS